MSKKTKTKTKAKTKSKAADHFRSAELQLNREVNAKRKAAAAEEGKKKGFLQELGRMRDTAPAYKEALKEGAQKTRYRGEQLIAPKLEEADRSQDPSKVESDPAEKGYIAEHRLAQVRKGIKES